MVEVILLIAGVGGGFGGWLAWLAGLLETALDYTDC